jgi:predicted sugar kinase
MNVQYPIRADYRFIKKVISSIMSGKVEDRPEEFDIIIEKFKKTGGSWIRIFRGSSKDIHLLKQIIKILFQKGELTKNPDWGIKKQHAKKRKKSNIQETIKDY